MDSFEYHRHEDHHCHREDPIFAAAEVLAIAMMASASRIVEALEGVQSTPPWVTDLEARMGAVEDAIARVEENLGGLSDEVGQIIDVLNELQNREDPAAAIAELNSVADRLGGVKDQLENATTLDDPAPSPAPGDGGTTEPVPSDGTGGTTEPVPGDAGGTPGDGTGTSSGDTSPSGDTTPESPTSGAGGTSGEITGPSGPDSQDNAPADLPPASGAPDQPQNDVV